MNELILGPDAHHIAAAIDRRSIRGIGIAMYGSDRLPSADIPQTYVLIIATGRHDVTMRSKGERALISRAYWVQQPGTTIKGRGSCARIKRPEANLLGLVHAGDGAPISRECDLVNMTGDVMPFVYTIAVVAIPQTYLTILASAD